MPAGTTYEAIETFTLPTAAATATFAVVPSTYTDLILTVVGAVNTSSYFTLRFNGDASSLYTNTEIDGTGTNTYTNRNTSATYMYNGSIVAGIQCSTITHIPNYSNATSFKTAITRSTYPSSGVKVSVGLYRSTSPITSITVGTGGTNTYPANITHFTLYGIKAA